MSVQNISKQTITEFVFRGFDTVQRPLVVGFVLLILYILVMIANLAATYFIVMDKHLHQPMYLFVCNLAIVDIVHCASTCPSMIGILIVGYKTIPYVPCIMQMFIFHLSGLMETFAIFIMAFDQFVAISSPAPNLTRIVLTRIGLVLTLDEQNGLMIGSILGPSLINPFMYCLRTKEIRNKIFKIVKKK
ncbi:LOW QUALITY PROTEIN: olfactory receptor 5AN1-like [Salminus brasiliensis]|uniref:LOW QUALITY PROTEIN: olfactory receptor 5AN1-like n=1 Tax=Salminus brasiliensis TaxID=930266 RepID=UPI003B82EB8F